MVSRLPNRTTDTEYGLAVSPPPAGGRSEEESGQPRRPPTPAGWLKEWMVINTQRLLCDLALAYRQTAAAAARLRLSARP